MSTLTRLAIMLVVASTAALAGCPGPGGDKPATTPAPPPAAPESTGVPECDEYLAVMATVAQCEAFAASREALLQSLEAQRQAFAGWKDLDATAREAAQQAAVENCRQSTDSTRQTATSLGCRL